MGIEHWQRGGPAFGGDVGRSGTILGEIRILSFSTVLALGLILDLDVLIISSNAIYYIFLVVCIRATHLCVQIIIFKY